jgi:hypothetical protein
MVTLSNMGIWGIIIRWSLTKKKILVVNQFPVLHQSIPPWEQ